MIGETIKDFKITAMLGKGGMGEVFSATQQLVKTEVAIKVLREEISRDRQHVQRFFNEAIAASKIKHAGIVKIFDAGFHDQRAYLIMELLEGESLAARIRRTPSADLDELLDIGAQLSSVLEATHAAQITHRDLKPDNVFLTPDAELVRKTRVKVLDFGIAKLGTPAPDAVGATVLTMSNSSMGTPAYMAPELWNDAANADARADVYALGCVMFELCTGRPPFVASSVGDACNRHLNDVPPRLRSLAPEAPAELDDLIAQMLAKAPAERPAMTAISATVAALRAKRSSATAMSATAPASRASESRDQASPPMPSPTAPGPPAPAKASAVHQPRSVKTMAAFGVVGVVAVVALGAGALVLSRRGSKADMPVALVANDVRTPAAAPPPISPPPSVKSAVTGGCPRDMVAIPAGHFWMGGLLDDEEETKPQHEVTLSPFCIDRTEVTVELYAACAAKGNCEPAPTIPRAGSWTDEKIKLWSRFCNGERADRKEHPINCVEWKQAAAFCIAAGKRLPTEAEWEFAARGNDGRVYPWGNEPPTGARLNACGSECRTMAKQFGLTWQVLYETDDGWDRTAPVGSYRDGASAFGVLDMAGNVGEWVADAYGHYSKEPQTNPTGNPTGDSRVVRNNDWESFMATEARSTHRSHYPPGLRLPYIGFRCAR